MADQEHSGQSGSGRSHRLSSSLYGSSSDDIVHRHHHHHHSSGGSSAGRNYQSRVIAASGAEAFLRHLPQTALVLSLILVLGGVAFALYRSNRALAVQVRRLDDRNALLDAENKELRAKLDDLEGRYAKLNDENASLDAKKEELVRDLSRLSQEIVRLKGEAK